MASSHKPDEGTPPYRSILTLDKSDEPFHTQLDEACTFLNIDLQEAQKNLIQSSVWRAEKLRDTYDPRPEWALRWLLKKLEALDKVLSSPRLQSETWLLLCQLLIRIPPANTARLLKEHHFVSILQRTFQEICEVTKQMSKTTLPRNRLLLERIDSSSDTLRSQSPSEIENDGSQFQVLGKRKREKKTSDVLNTEDLGTFYLAISGVLVQLEGLIENPENIHGFATEYMKSALRGSADEMARILGNSLHIADYILNRSKRKRGSRSQTESHTRKSDELLVNAVSQVCVPAVVRLWALPSDFLQGPNISSNVDNNAFKAYCMLPTLQLLSTCREWPESVENMDVATNLLAELLVKFVISPFRATHLDSLNPVDSLSDGNLPLKDALVSALQEFGLAPTSEEETNDNDLFPKEKSFVKTQTHLVLTLLSLLFEVALGYRARDTSQQRQAEFQWLEDLFLQVVGCATALLPPVSSVRPHKECSRLIKWLLRKSVQHKLRLSVQTMEGLLDQRSGMFSDANDCPIECDIVSLCLTVDVDTFVLPATSSGRHEIYSYRWPNKYLSCLLSKLTGHIGRNDSGISQKNHIVKRVLLPLCDGFAKARDLVGFIGHWRERLDIIQTIRNSNPDGINLTPSIWEDEQLLGHVAKSVESTLTANQIEEIFSSLISDLTPPTSSVPNDASLSLPSLVIIDTLCAGIIREDIMAQLSDGILSIYGSLSGLLKSSQRSTSCTYRWWLWRIMTSITDHCYILHGNVEFKRKAHFSICNAVELINRIPRQASPEEVKDFTEEFQAFRFILSFVAKEDPFWEGLQFSSREKITTAAGKVLDTMKLFCSRISQDHFGSICKPSEGSESAVQTFGSKVVSIAQFHMACIAVMSSQDAICFLDKTLQSQLTEQLYWCAVYEQRFSLSGLADSPNYSWLWKQIFRPQTLENSSSASENVREFLVDRYLISSDFVDPKFFDIRASTYTVAFESVRSMDHHVFNRHLRTKLANRILRILLVISIPNYAQIADLLSTLAKLVAIPNKSMDVLVSAPKALEKTLAYPEDEVPILSLARIIDCKRKWTKESMACMDSLRTLTSSVLRYLQSNINQPTSAEYIRVFHNQVASELEHINGEPKDCPSAFSIVVEVFLSACHEFHDNLVKYVEPVAQSHYMLQQRHLEIGLDSLSSYNGDMLLEPAHRHACGVKLECLASYSDLFVMYPDIKQISRNVFGKSGLRGPIEGIAKPPRHESPEISSLHDYCDHEYLATRLARLELLLSSRDSNAHQSLLDMSRQLSHVKSARERNKLFQSLKRVITKLGLQAKKELCFEYDLDQIQCLDPSELLRLQIASFSLQDAEIEELGDALPRVIALVCQGLTRTSDFRTSMMSMQCISMLLQRHPRVISQWHIDSILSVITIRSSRMESQKKDSHSGKLFIGLCRLFHSILALHRVKIGGRYHLVLPALQALLRCLFIPYSNQDSGEDKSPRLGGVQAAAYTKILTMLCDPTVSSVTRFKKQSRLQLKDETQKARSIAGQYLQYLIMEYCQCQLSGLLLPEMKEILDVGLHGILAVMSQEVIRTMNAAMDSSGRSVFKALYENYKRLRKSPGG